MSPCDLGSLHKVEAPYFQVIYIVELYKEDFTILKICLAVGPCLSRAVVPIV